MEASMEAWKLPWKLSRFHAVELSMKASMDASVEAPVGLTPTELFRGSFHRISRESFHGCFHGSYFHGSFRESFH